MSLAGVIVMGGKNTRMGGRKKAFLTLNGKYFYEHILASMKNVNKIYFSVENVELYKNLNYELIEDIIKNIGPIGGLYSILKSCNDEAFLILPSDTPFINTQIVDRLIDLYYETNRPIVLMDENNYINPLIGIYTRDCLPVIEKMISDKNYKIGNIFKMIDHQVLKFNDLGLDSKFLQNCNDELSYKALTNND